MHFYLYTSSLIKASEVGFIKTSKTAFLIDSMKNCSKSTWNDKSITEYFSS